MVAGDRGRGARFPTRRSASSRCRARRATRSCSADAARGAISAQWPLEHLVRCAGRHITGWIKRWRCLSAQIFNGAYPVHAAKIGRAAPHQLLLTTIRA